MKRVIVICEGPTEQTFVKTNLQIPFIGKGIILQTPLIKSSRGGIVKWPKLKDQIERHLKSEPETYVTTFIDYYGMYSKHEFPGWEVANAVVDKNARVAILEKAMMMDIKPDCRHRFIPYLQLHEFEGLLFNEIDVFFSQIPERDIVGKAELNKTFEDYPNPEMINDSAETSPSNRLQRIIRGYNKVVHGNILAEAIGLVRIRDKSPRFNSWIAALERI